MMYKNLGIDIGSTTIKAILTDGQDVLLRAYKRHHADIDKELSALLAELSRAYPGEVVRARVTGSAGISAAERLGVPFVQEVVAETLAVRRALPDTDVILELGGEDAKITFLRPALEQRMNGSCAGGTGSFIDQMADLLKTDAQGLNALAEKASHIYPIASRCGVFAKSDLQPLLNEGAAREDLAASVFSAVVNQTVAGLACGHKIEGNVVLLGGPLYFLPALRAAFERRLAGGARCTLPDDAQLFVALGAAQAAEAGGEEPVSLDTLCVRWRTGQSAAPEVKPLAPLFDTDADYRAFRARHAAAGVPAQPLTEQKGPLFLGIDAGSTTTKATLLNRDGALVYNRYGTNGGSPVDSALAIARDMADRLPEGAYIARACVTGYGENLIRAALLVDEGEIETVAHARAAQWFCPDVDCVIDIGGQDMKCIRLSDGVITHILLNEACSSGCGSFLQTFAQALSLDVADFAREALASRHPVDLGTRCTVFMNSRVKQAQKEGAGSGDLSAGLSYSVVRTALYKVIKLRGPEQMGRRIVVQGGTFLNDAVLRCFELISGQEVIRPDIAGLMGAFGAALIAKERWDGESASQMLDAGALAAFTVQTKAARCNRCENHCRLTVSTFDGSRRLISGNRCERGAGGVSSEIPSMTGIQESPPHPIVPISAAVAGKDAEASPLPNLFDYKAKRLFDYPPLPPENAPRGEIGIPRALNMYENYPLWHTALTRLGFRVVLSGPSSHAMFEKGMHTIPSESVCYPAKLAHGHVIDLIEKGVKTIFYPCVPYERNENPDANNHFNCPIVTSYPEVIRSNVDEARRGGVTLISPFLPLDNPAKLAVRLAEALSAFGVTADEAKAAADEGFAELARFHRDMRDAGDAALAELARTGGRGIVLAGRPYHADPEIHHGIPEMIHALGLAVLTEDSIAEPGVLARPIRVRDQWMYHTRLYEAAARVGLLPMVELTQLTSFGCGLDAITSDQVQEILSASGRVYTLLKIDEVSSLGAARIRMRSLLAVMNATKKPHAATSSAVLARPMFTRQMKKTHTMLAPQMAPTQFKLLEGALRSDGYNLAVLPDATEQDIETGLKYVNNDACYPAIIVIGQMMNALLSGRYDTDRVALMITQTGGGCRATNYTGLLRKALKDANLAHVPVVALSVTGIEKNPGMRYTPRLVTRALQAIVLGDLLSTLTLRIRPYERMRGQTDALLAEWLDRLHAALEGPGLKLADAAEEAITSFEALDFDRGARRPRVGVVGEILVKFHPDANNHVVRLLEDEGCEAVMPGLLDFFLYGFSGAMWRHEHLGSGLPGALASDAGAKLLERYASVVRKRLRASDAGYFVSSSIYDLRGKAETVLSLGNVCGEGWFLTGEMIELIESGVPNVVCAQPFACLPNHVTGKGMIREIRRRYPEANIVAVDYDSGASEVNQMNRIKLMVATASERATAEGAAQEEDAAGESQPHGLPRSGFRLQNSART